jgi:hypothetical protein
MVAANPSLPLEKTTGLPAAGPGMQQAWNQSGKAPANLLEWNAHYQARAEKYPAFVITTPIALRLTMPAVYARHQLAQAFHAMRVPVTQTYKRLTSEEFSRLLRLLRSN